jgi:hypothetical protein
LKNGIKIQIELVGEGWRYLVFSLILFIFFSLIPFEKALAVLDLLLKNFPG